MSAYLYVNAVLYGLFAIWCTVQATNTATNLGYVSLTNGGRSEYLVVYGGLQLGLAVMFFLLARDEAYHKLGILISIGVYVPIVVYRLITVWKFSPVAPLTLGTGALEATLLLAAIWLWIARVKAG